MLFEEMAKPVGQGLRVYITDKDSAGSENHERHRHDRRRFTGMMARLGRNPFLAPEGHEVRPKRVERRQPGGYDAGYKKHDVNAAVGMALQAGAKGGGQDFVLA